VERQDKLCGIIVFETFLFVIPLDHYTFQDFLDDYKKRSLMGLFFGGLIMSMGLAKAVVSTICKNWTKRSN
jgi:hypothetical protein